MEEYSSDILIFKDKLDRENHALTEFDVEPLKRYVEHRLPPGSFFMAVICNDLKGAAFCADTYHRRRLFEFVNWLYNKAPYQCWGSIERYRSWMLYQEVEDDQT